MPRAIGYVRQSLGKPGETSETSLSLDAQEERIRSWAESNHWVLEEVVRDHDLKGTTLDRPGWNRVIETVERGGIDAVIVFALSRLARDNLLQETAWRQLKSYGCRLIATSEPAAEDTMVRGILGVMSQAERERSGRFISSSVQHRLQRGIRWGKMPFGFRRTGHPGERARGCEIDSETEDTARRIIELAGSGESVVGIAVALRDEGRPNPSGGEIWDDSAIRKWLASPAIAGGVRAGQEIIWDAHPAYITRTEWERIQRLIDARSKTRALPKVDTLLHGILYHGCGLRMTAHRVMNAKYPTVEHISYVCQRSNNARGGKCTHYPIVGSEKKINGAALEALGADLSQLMSVSEALDQWNREHDGQSQMNERKRIERQLLEGNRTAERAEALYLKGQRGLEWLERQDSAWAQQRLALEAQLSALDRQPDRLGLERARQQLTSMSATLRFAEKSDLQPTLRSIGTVHLDGDYLRWHFNDDYALLARESTRQLWR